MQLEFCPLTAVDELMAFLRAHWGADHILARHRKLVDWQYRDEHAGRYNFLLARDTAGTIAGLLGFIPASRYDPGLAGEEETVWFAVWKVRPDAPPGLGLQLLRSLERQLRPKWIGTVGLNEIVRPIYDACGYRTDWLSRYFLINPDPTRWVLVSGEPLPGPEVSGNVELAEVPRNRFWTDTDELGLDARDQVPRKTRALIQARYLEHPFYDYRVFLARAAGGSLLLVARECRHDGAMALRIVDMLGEESVLTQCGPAFLDLLRQSGAEYIDFYCSAADHAIIGAGFRRLERDNADVVLPSYFEPFEPGNVNILYCIKGPGERPIICKGDADQDRPNLLD